MSTARPPAQPNESLSRRGFYVGAIYAMGTAIMAMLGAPALAYLLLPPKLRKSDEWVEAGDTSRLTLNVPVEITFRRNRVDGWKITSEKSTAWVVKHEDNSLVA